MNSSDSLVSRSWKVLTWGMVFVFVALAGALPVQGAGVTHTWKSAPGGTNWSTASNWDTEAAPGVSDYIVFSNSTQTTLNNDLPDLRSYGSSPNNDAIVFSPGAPAYTLNGNRIRLALWGGRGIRNLSSNLQTINFDIQAGTGYQAQFTAADGDIVVNGRINGIGTSGSQHYAVGAYGSGTLTLAGDNSTMTNVYIYAGATVKVTNPSGLGASGSRVVFFEDLASLYLATDTALTGTYDMSMPSGGNDASITLDRATPGDGDVITHTMGSLTFLWGQTLIVTNGANVTSGTPTLVFTNTIASSYISGSPQLTMAPAEASIVIQGSVATGSRAYRLNLGGTSTGNAISGAMNMISAGGASIVTKQDTSTWTLSGSNTFTGGTVINGGTLKTGHPSALGGTNGVVTIAAAGTLDLNGSVLNAKDPVITAGAVITNSTGSSTLNLNVTVAKNLNGALKTGVGSIALTKNGAATLTLSAGDAYDGDTRVLVGTLVLPTAFLSDQSDVYLTTGGVLNLTFSGTNTIGQLYLDDAEQGPGVYNASTPGFAALLPGTGSLLVSPPRGTVVLIK